MTSDPITREEILFSLSMIWQATRDRDRLTALELLNELIEALQVDQALEECEEAVSYGVQLQ